MKGFLQSGLKLCTQNKNTAFICRFISGRWPQEFPNYPDRPQLFRCTQLVHCNIPLLRALALAVWFSIRQSEDENPSEIVIPRRPRWRPRRRAAAPASVTQLGQFEKTRQKSVWKKNHENDATLWQILNMKDVWWPETETMWLGQNVLVKTREITWWWTYFWRVLAIWNHSETGLLEAVLALSRSLSLLPALWCPLKARTQWS